MQTSFHPCFQYSDSEVIPQWVNPLSLLAGRFFIINEQTVFAISEKAHYSTEFTKGNTMQFWLAFDAALPLRQAYDVLKEQAELHCALGPGDWCKEVADLTDQYGIRWLLSY
jgi:uncharacterized glyoxalase superfamily protein PhnB